jgi:carbon storage regulator
MLILTRREGQRIVIGGEKPADQRIIVTVAYIGKNSVRLGIEAPEGVEVHREEVQERIDAAKETQTQGDDQ